MIAGDKSQSLMDVCNDRSDFDRFLGIYLHQRECNLLIFELANISYLRYWITVSRCRTGQNTDNNLSDLIRPRMCSQTGIWRLEEARSTLGSARIERLPGHDSHRCQDPGFGALIVAANGGIIFPLLTHSCPVRIYM